MPGKDATKLSKRTVDTLCDQSAGGVLGSGLRGFGVGSTPRGLKSMLSNRAADGPKRVTRPAWKAFGRAERLRTQPS